MSIHFCCYTRRLYPGLGFFQIATDHPCIALTTLADGVETLRKRVEKSVLKAQNVSKNRLGVTATDVSVKGAKVGEGVRYKG